MHLATGTLFAVVIALFFSSSPAQSDRLTPGLTYGYKTYFRHHPPTDIRVNRNFYPFPGPVIQDDGDIPVCAAARAEGTYSRKKDIRYLLHGKNGWIFRTSDFKMDFKASSKTLEYFNRLNKLLAARHQILAVVFQPPRGMVAEKHIDFLEAPKGYTPQKAREGYKSFLRQLNSIGIVTVDLSDVPADIAYFPKGDSHWTSEGARYSAYTIAKELQNVPAYTELEKGRFESAMAGMGPANRGAFEEFLQSACQVNIGLTTEPLWLTQRVGGSQKNTSFPAVTVMGTNNSFSESKFNFVGFLRQFLQADVYNAAVAGGFGASAYRYFSSEEYRVHPPKIVIWEFLPHHDYNDNESTNAFRQMIPAIHGACSKAQASAQFDGNLTKTQTDVLTQLAGQSLKDSFLYLDVTNPTERTLKVEILYKDGNADQIDLTRSIRNKNNGEYYLELSDNTDKQALFFRIVTDTPRGHLTARLCQYPTYVAEK